MNLRRIYRSTRTGLFVSKTDAQANQDTTISETLEPSAYPIGLHEAIARSINKRGVHGTIRHLLQG